MAGQGSHSRNNPRFDCTRVEELLGAYVLKRLTGRDLTLVDRHLVWCAQCRATYDYISVVPYYLDLLTDDDVQRMSAEFDNGPVVRTGAGIALEGSAVAGRQAHWRRRVAVATATAGLVAGLFVGATIRRPAETSPPVVADLVAEATDRDTGVSATIVVTPRASEVAVRMTASGLAPATRHRLYLITRENRALAVVEWRSAHGTLSATGVVPVAAEDLRFLAIGTHDGRVVLSVSFGHGGLAPTALPRW